MGLEKGTHLQAPREDLQVESCLVRARSQRSPLSRGCRDREGNEYVG